MQQHSVPSDCANSEFTIDPAVLEKYRLKKDRSDVRIISNTSQKKKRRRFDPIAYLENDTPKKKMAKLSDESRPISADTSTKVSSNQHNTSFQQLPTAPQSPSKELKNKTLLDELNFNKKKLKVEPLAKLVANLQGGHGFSTEMNIKTINSNKEISPQSTSNIQLDTNSGSQNAFLTNQDTARITLSTPPVKIWQGKEASTSSPSVKEQTPKSLKNQALGTKSYEIDEYTRLLKEEAVLRKKLEEIQRKKQQISKSNSTSPQATKLSTKMWTTPSKNNNNRAPESSDELNSSNEDDEFEEVDENELKKMSPEQLEEYYNKNYSSIIRKLARHKTKYRNFVDLSDDSDMETSFDEIIKEEEKRFPSRVSEFWKNILKKNESKNIAKRKRL
jgi:hypothetical protein